MIDYVALVSPMIEDAMEEHPHITYRGYDRLNHPEYEEEREKLRNAVEEVARAYVFLTMQGRTKAINRDNKGTSSLKLQARKYFKQLSAENPYVSEGATLLAAVLAGFKYKRFYDAHCHLNISQHAFRRLPR